MGTDAFAHPTLVFYFAEIALEGTRHEYQVVRLWEQNPAIFLQDVALLPLAALAATVAPEQLLTQVAQAVSKIEASELRREVATCTQLLAGLRSKKSLIQQFFRGEFMKESVIYQETVSPEAEAQIQALSLAQLEELGEALLEFSNATDLMSWLQAYLQ
ncbi:MAG: DUF4351 domain-containing protein [Cyanobacteria bacterium CRU_2_1]|nr:DUF4351 domain-containing protein [Cyanobacteria bacterium RU_5_0]NJR58157.1 DUF4351 domain-containing protein [Cyanobacteria bacterium CRU_2_1]